MNLPIVILLLVGLVASALMVALLRNLLKACIGLSLVSGILALLMFAMGAHLAAVFELSVCAGLITVVFVSAISMTKVLSKEEAEEMERQRRKRFRYLPVVLTVVLVIALVVLWPYLSGLTMNTPMPHLAETMEEEMIWNQRQTDLLAQVIIVLVGIYAVLIFFKKGREEQ